MRMAILCVVASLCFLSCPSPTDPGSDPPLGPAVPANVRIETSGSTYLRWDAVLDADDYRIYYSSSEAGTYNAGPVRTVTEYTVTDVGIWYRVTARNELGESAQSLAVYH